MSQLLAYLRLCRAANVFTALADIILGYWLTHSAPLDEEFSFPLPLGWLLLASGCLYTAGMVWNDYFDRHVDAVERPKRPIPSGQISPHAAVRLGTVLVLAGLTAAGIAGLSSLVVAVLLVASIFLYDGLAKKYLIGPWIMGSCRTLNVLLGASLPAVFVVNWTDLPAYHFDFLHVQVAAALGVYIAGVTTFAKQEAGRSSVTKLAWGLLIADVGLGLLICRAYTWPDARHRVLYATLVLIMVAITINRRALAALQNPAPGPVQVTVKLMILSLVMLDASFVLLAAPTPLWAIATALLILPTMLLARFLAVT